jgi:hypothetical protein
MAKILNTCSLINTSLRRAMIPSDQSTFSCCDIIDIMNEELSIHVVPMVMRVHEEHFVFTEDQCVCACKVRYKIPYRAIGNKLRDVQYIDGSSIYEMTRISPEDRPSYNTGYIENQAMSFYLENDNIVLSQQQSGSGKIRSSYYLRPNELVKASRAGTISAVCVGCCTTTFTLSNFPAHFSCTTTFDIIQGKSPNKIITFDATVCTSNSGVKTITFDNDQLKIIDHLSTTPKAATFTVGDYILKAEESHIPQLPTELQPILAQRTAVKMLEALGDIEGVKLAQNELDRMEYNANTLIDNRVEGAPQKIRNTHSALKEATGSKFTRRRGL